MLRDQKGITIIALVVTIIILLILTGITIQGSMNGVNDSQEDKMWTELDMVQHAIVQRETKFKLTNDEKLLVGTKLNNSDMSTISIPDGKTINWKVNMADTNDAEKSYYRLVKEDIKELGLEPGADSSTNTYIVNYYTGEVYNETSQTAPKSGTLLYITLKLDNN